MHLHIGHHFYGTGNCGDDWMLAGFLAALGRSGLQAKVTCLTTGSLSAMHQRFPSIEWFPCNQANRLRLISNSDLWLGLGGTPFQTDSSSWMLDHLDAELQVAAAAGRPAYMLGIGVEHATALRDPRARNIAARLKHIWTRDESSAALLSTVTAPHRITAGADLAHIYLSQADWPETPSRDNRALIYNVELTAQYRPAPLIEFLASGDYETDWIAQEVRVMRFSEMFVWSEIPEAVRARLHLAHPNYLEGSLRDLLIPWAGISSCLTTRYHGAIAAAWRGARVAVFPRSAKLLSLAAELDCGIQASLDTSAGFSRGFAAARPVSFERLEKLAVAAAKSCNEFFRAIG